MSGEENGHYTGKVDKYEDGRIVFRLDKKICEFRRKSGRMKRKILFERDDFYMATGIKKEESICVGRSYNIDRKYTRKIAENILISNGKDIKKGNPADEELDLSGFIKDGEISGTGIVALLNEDDEKDND